MKVPPNGNEGLRPVKSAPNLVTVLGFDQNDVIFSSDQVGCVQWRDSNGEIVAMLIRIKPDIWGFSKRGDSDWAEIVESFGNKNC